MYLSDRDLKFAVETGQLIVDPPPTEYDTTSIDLHLDKLEAAKIWDVDAFKAKQADAGDDPWLRVGKYPFRAFSQEFYRNLPTDPTPANGVYRVGDRVILRPGGFFLWQTREAVRTPEVDPRRVCFIDEKSSSARTGLLVHMKASTIHAGWWA
jgi:deoxycytidine triphosphate deaminase